MLGKQKIVKLMYSLISLFIVMVVYPIKINGEMGARSLSLHNNMGYHFMLAQL